MLSHHLYRHMRTSHQNEDETYTLQCPECDEQFLQRELFFDHCLNHAQESLICPMCKLEADSIEIINDHICVHSKSDMYFCDYCSCIFMNQDELNEHFMEKHSEELCAIGEDEIEFIVEKPTPKIKREKKESADAPLSKRSKPNVTQEIQFLSTPIPSGASFIEYEEIAEPVKIEKPKAKLIKPTAKKPEKEEIKKSVTTVQRVKMSQSEIKRLQMEGKIIMQDGLLVMKQ